MANLGFCKIVEGSLTTPTNGPFTKVLINKSICFYPIIINVCQFKLTIQELIGGGQVISIPKAIYGKTAIYLGVTGSPQNLSFSASLFSSRVDVWGILSYENLRDTEFKGECTINMISVEIM